MKELLKSKAMIGFVIFVLGAVLLNSYTIKQEQKNVSVGSTNNNEIINK